MDLLNFTATPVSIALVGGSTATVPGASMAPGGFAPGTASVTVPSTEGAASTFSTRVGTRDLTVTCTVTPSTWLDIRPNVVVQMSGYDMTCSNW